MMFDPYHKWLGILPKDQPPNLYRLLNLELYEGDPEVVEGAADRAMSFIRQYQSGEHASLAARLLNEIASARLCLLKPKLKAEYDAKLKRELTASSAANETAPVFSFGSDLEKPENRQTKNTKKETPPKGIWIAGGVALVCVLMVAAFVSVSSKTLPPKERKDQIAANSDPTAATQNDLTKHDDKASPVEAVVAAETSPPMATPVVEKEPVVEPKVEPIVAEPATSPVEQEMKETPSSSLNSNSEELGNFVILDAKYGVDDRYVDITNRVAAALESGVLSVAVDDTLVESGQAVPAATKNITGRKFLHLEYRLNGEEKSQTVEETGVFQIDARPASATKVSKGFRLIEARRGTGLFRGSNWEDVTKQFRTYVKKDSLTLTSEELNKALKIKDNDESLPKAIFIRYHFEGHEQVALLPGGAPVFLGDAPLLPGLIMVAYAGENFEKQRMVAIESNIDVDYGYGAPGPDLPSDKFSVRWLGMLNVTKTANYTFYMNNDDGARLWIDGELLMDNWQTGGAEIEVKLTKKQHPIKVEFCDRQVSGFIHLEWKSNSISRTIIPASAFFYEPKVAKQFGLK